MKSNIVRLLTSVICLFFSISESFSQAPVADFTSPDPEDCFPHIVVFADASQGNPTSWLWDFGDPNAPATSSLENPSHNYSTTGTFQVTLIVSNAFGSDTIVKPTFVKVYRNPQAAYTVSQDTVCPNQPITFTDASTPGDTIVNMYEWTWNDGQPVSTTNPSFHSFQNNTSQNAYFNPTYTATDGHGCSTTIVGDTLVVLPSPNASFTVDPVSCNFPATVNFSNTSGQPQAFTWDFGDPSSGTNNYSNQANPSHLYNSPGSYLVTLTNGVNGCMAQDTLTITLDVVDASFSAPTVACVGTSLSFINTSSPAAATFEWNFGDSTTSNATNPTHAYSAPSMFTATLTAAVGNCVDVMQQQIEVPYPPIASFDLTDSTSCQVPLTITFEDQHPANVSWSWDFGDPGSGSSNTSTSQSPSHTYNSFGSYTVNLVAADANGCTDTATFSSITLTEPVITIDPALEDSGCVGSIFDYTATIFSPADPNIVSYTWNFGDGTGYFTQSTPQIDHQYNDTGVFDVSLTITTATGCTVTLTDSAFARAGTKPQTEIDSTLQTICFQGTITFHDLTPQPVTGWHWYFGEGGQNLDSPNPVYTYDNDTSGTALSDIFDITLFSYFHGCEDSDRVVNMITVLSPIPFFEPTIYCDNQDSVTFQNLTLTLSNNTYVWNFGDGSATVTTTDAYHVYPGVGSYDVTLEASNATNGCVVDTVITVNVYHTTAYIEAPAQLCFPTPAYFRGNNSTDADSLWWYFGDPASGSSDTLIQKKLQSTPLDTAFHSFSSPGIYTVKLKIKDKNGCYDSTTVSIHMIGPVADFAAFPTTGCLNLPVGFPVTFTDNSVPEGGAIIQWSWDFGDSTAVLDTTAGNAIHNYMTSGIYPVTLTVTDVNGCSSSHVFVDGINPTAPQASISNSNTGCSNSPKHFVGSAGPSGTYRNPVTYQWDFGDGATWTSGDSTVDHNYTEDSIYVVTLTITDSNQCTSTVTQILNVYTTSSDFNVSTTTTCATDTHGIRRAKVTGDFDHIDQSHTVAAIYDWNFTLLRDTTNTTIGDYHRDFLSFPPGSYDVTLILTNDFGCKDTSTVLGAVVVPGPTGSYAFTPDSGCAPLSVDFTGTSPNTNSFVWDFGDGNVLSGSMTNISHTYLLPGVYKAQFLLGFQLQNDFCYVPVDTGQSIVVSTAIDVNIAEQIVTIPTPGAIVPVNVSIVDPQGVGAPYQYNWTPAGYVTQTSATTFDITSDLDTTLFMLTVPYGNGCSGIDTVRVIGYPCDIKWDSVPNVFTPDGDFKNDTYYIEDLCMFDDFYIRIYNRWGKLIYESNDSQFKWDGKTSSGADASEGTYYYVLSAKKRDHHGYIELIRKK